MEYQSIFLAWTERDIKGLDFATLYTEINQFGLVTREVGINAIGMVVHKFPSQNSPRGCFDLAIVNFDNLTSDISMQQFEQLWAAPVEL